MDVPLSWSDQVQKPPNRLPPTIAFKQSTGAPFYILITPLWQIGNAIPAMAPLAMKKKVTAAADNAQAQAVESTIEIKELVGASGVGYYFSATDRAPKPGEYKFITQGMIRVGQVTVTFCDSYQRWTERDY
jgi:hypothetical protein